MRKIIGPIIAICIVMSYVEPTSSRAYFEYVQPPRKALPKVEYVGSIRVKATGYFGPVRKDYANKKDYLCDVAMNGSGKETRSGTKPRIGTIAADNGIYGFGTKVYIPEINFYGTIEDTGGKVRGPHRIDIFCGFGKEAKKIARTWEDGKRVTMLIVKKA